MEIPGSGLVRSRKVYTIGYGNRRFEDFVRLLKKFGVELVIDVRAFPTSRWPEFIKENLQNALPAEGIGYAHLRELGGYRRGGYEAYLQTEDFERGIAELQRLASGQTAAIMCVESHPSACHRRFIAKKLCERGWEVIHIVGKAGKTVVERSLGTKGFQRSVRRTSRPRSVCAHRSARR